jgi:hypothetical protein
LASEQIRPVVDVFDAALDRPRVLLQIHCSPPLRLNTQVGARLAALIAVALRLWTSLRARLAALIAVALRLWTSLCARLAALIAIAPGWHTDHRCSHVKLVALGLGTIPALQDVL